ncbi:hypothetical protein P7D22_19775 [Lichenihabitans sp. Uapishka_5]|uniref:hypothetical protein n=1 Tax=Lichenihabitans sp. Uapishka_5 TaxID=3037302 RepID=UPI0029E7F644|nr:hypothetical protein [Lichenihabitans sp. Uapishka_5]MDX7953408.1 hypothetical protein [Lichenihabitans sp. Uapishka_5]
MAAAALTVPATILAAAPAGSDADLIALGAEMDAAWAFQRDVQAATAGGVSQMAESKFEAAFERTAEIVDRIEALTATTLAGLRVKLRGIDWCRDGDTLDERELFNSDKPTTDLRLIVAILADLRATD